MIINVSVDKEKVKSMISMTETRERFIKKAEYKQFPTIIAENYYEIIKEIGTAILLLDGKKAIGDYAHKEIIEQLKTNDYIDELESRVIDDLRIKRNKSQYEGKQFELVYIENNEKRLLLIIQKLKKIIDKKVK